MTALTTHTPRTRQAPAWIVARWVAFPVTAGCVAVHLALLLGSPSALAALMAILAALCLICLTPRSRPLPPSAWGMAMAMSMSMMLLHIGSAGGMVGHAHGRPAGVVPIDGLHGFALLLNGIELVLLMAVVVAIGVLRRRRMSARSGTRSVNMN